MSGRGAIVNLRSKYDSGLSRLSKALFPTLQRLGIHVVHNDFHGPIPDTRQLPASLWEKRSELVGIDMNEVAQLDFLNRISALYRSEYESFPLERGDDATGYFVNNGYFESVDGEVYYCLIREHKPRCIVEVGAGHSTTLAAKAIAANKVDDPNSVCALTAIDPSPTRLPHAGLGELSELIECDVQQLDPSWFTKLDSGDILFIDSSHVLKIGNDVWFEYLEVIPRLNPGVLVHAHDIFLPAHYRRETVVRDRWFWNEQYLLQAFLSFNEQFEVLWGGSWMHLNHPQALENAFPSYSRRSRWPGSLWFRRVVR
jgi:hypothetical protein